MAAELRSADLVLARAGATTVAELAAAGRPALLVPFARATGSHQEENARALAGAGAAEVILEDELTPESLATRIRELATQPGRLEEMGTRAKELARPEAARLLAQRLFDLAGDTA